MTDQPRRGLRPLLVVFVTAAAAAVLVGCAPSPGTPDPGQGAASAEANSRRSEPVPLHSSPSYPFLDAAQRPAKLRGLNVVPLWTDNPGATWPIDRYEQIAVKGFTAVRFVLYWDDFEPNRGRFEAAALATLDRAIANAKAAGLYVVLDEIHLWGQGGFSDVPRWARRGDALASVLANGRGYLRMLARRYRHEPAVAAYDPVNEPRPRRLDQTVVLSAYAGLIATIREVDPEKIILVEPAYGDSSVSPETLAPLAGLPNVVWSPHLYYAGGDDDGYAENGSQAGKYTWDGASGYDPSERSALGSHLLLHVNAARSARLPIWVGEVGIGAGASNSTAWIADMVALLDRYGVEFAWWEYHTGNSFSATDANFGWRPWVDLLVRSDGQSGGDRELQGRWGRSLTGL